jgi:hypothetical protein
VTTLGPRMREDDDGHYDEYGVALRCVGRIRGNAAHSALTRGSANALLPRGLDSRAMRTHPCGVLRSSFAAACRTRGGPGNSRQGRKKKPTMLARGGFLFGVPRGFRTPVTTVKGSCPRPLDDGDFNLWLYCDVRVSGGGKRDRTADLLHAMQALSQLSYTPAYCCTHLLPNIFECVASVLLPLRIRSNRANRKERAFYVAPNRVSRKKPR